MVLPPDADSSVGCNSFAIPVDSIIIIASSFSATLDDCFRFLFCFTGEHWSLLSAPVFWILGFLRTYFRFFGFTDESAILLLSLPTHDVVAFFDLDGAFFRGERVLSFNIGDLNKLVDRLLVGVVHSSLESSKSDDEVSLSEPVRLKLLTTNRLRLIPRVKISREKTILTEV